MKDHQTGHAVLFHGTAFLQLSERKQNMGGVAARMQFQGIPYSFNPSRLQFDAV